MAWSQTPSPLDRLKNLQPVDPAVMRRFEALAKARAATDRQHRLEQSRLAHDLRKVVLF